LVLFVDGNEELKNVTDSSFNATISLYDSLSTGKHDINLTILKSSDVLRSIETVLYSEKEQEIYLVMFGKPLLVKKNTRYTIQLNMEGSTA
jgi:hypothetical protein